jgi:hypothetical protein
MCVVQFSTKSGEPARGYLRQGHAADRLEEVVRVTREAALEAQYHATPKTVGNTPSLYIVSYGSCNPRGFHSH